MSRPLRSLRIEKNLSLAKSQPLSHKSLGGAKTASSQRKPITLQNTIQISCKGVLHTPSLDFDQTNNSHAELRRSRLSKDVGKQRAVSLRICYGFSVRVQLARALSMLGSSNDLCRMVMRTGVGIPTSYGISALKGT